MFTSHFPGNGLYQQLVMTVGWCSHGIVLTTLNSPTGGFLNQQCHNGGTTDCDGTVEWGIIQVS